MKLLWEERAWNDYLYWQTQDKKIAKKKLARTAQAVVLASFLMR